MDDVNFFPTQELKNQVRDVLENAIDAYKRGLKIYESLRNLSEVIGTEYGDRVLYELIQNAHDAHDPEDAGRIAIRLVIRSDKAGDLYIANDGHGFRKEDVEAIKNLATSAKEVGEGIGNKGLGFRSIEALTDDVRIFSQPGKEKSNRFLGYCFRFASEKEIEAELRSLGEDENTSSEIAKSIPRYLVPKSLSNQRKEITSYARLGYATVIVIPLRTPESVNLASEQVESLVNLDAPLLLFLDRIAEVRIDVEKPNQRPYGRRLNRRQKLLGEISRLKDCVVHEVSVGRGRRFYVVRRTVDKEKVLSAVESSIPRVPQLKRWLDWKGQPEVSVAVGLTKDAVKKDRLYNFLPMGEGAEAPLFGYIDAPFFTDIDRSDAVLRLPLNQVFIKAAAEACAASSLSIIEDKLPIAQRAVFDMFAWTNDHASFLDDALEKMGSALEDAPTIPVIAERGTKEWASISQVRIWPKGTFSVLSDLAVARHVSARLVSRDLDAGRVSRLREVAKRTYWYRNLVPTSEELANWLEMFAQSLLSRNLTFRTWSSYYNDIPKVFVACDANLESLDGKKIFLDRSKRLRPAGGWDDATQAWVYVRYDLPKGKRKKAGIPLPPATLTRRFRFLNERIKLKRDTLNVLIETRLIREYDPVEALAGLKSALGTNANNNRWQEALKWAFRMWRTASTKLEKELQEANLHVPTLSGWQPADRTVFSSSWTSLGKKLENYLMEAAVVSEDCKRAHDLLLIGQEKWPVSIENEKRNWVKFLELIGVSDGMQPIPVHRNRKYLTGWNWDMFLRNGDDSEGFDEIWCSEVTDVSFNHPYTEYRMKKCAWRLPGQIEYEELPESSKEILCEIIFEHFKVHSSNFFQFEVGRFERTRSAWDSRILPTPLATFLRNKAWIVANTYDGIAFKRPNECWASRMRQGKPPRFVDRVQGNMADLIEDGEFAEFAFSKNLELQDWQSPKTAIARLRNLTKIAENLASSDRPAARSEYRRAWQDCIDTEVSLPSDLGLVVSRSGRTEVLYGVEADPPDVIITEDARMPEAQILSDAGQPVLDVGSAQADKVVEMLKNTGVFEPLRLDGVGVRLHVDGELFFPQSSDELLISQGLDWLPEVIVIGNEILGEQLERGILSSTIDRRIRSMRVRRCETVTLVVGEGEKNSSQELRWYAFDDEQFPTLILPSDLPINWLTLADSFSDELTRLIDRRLKSIRLLLARLCLNRTSDLLEAPSDENLARALRCDIQTVQDHRAALRTNLEHVLYLLIPIVAYYGDVALSKRLRSDADRSGEKLDVRKWLQHHLTSPEAVPERLIEACQKATNRINVCRSLKLDYGRFNRILQELDEPALSDGNNLQQLYDAYLAQMRPVIIERLRRHHVVDFREEEDLTIYVERKKLSFLEFNTDWVQTRETLDMELVERHVSMLLDETLGEDVSVKLPALDGLVKTNRRVVREFAANALPVLQVWCRKNNVELPELWTQLEMTKAVAWHLENKGLLDFEAVKPERTPKICQRGSCWPIGMPETTDVKTLKLDQVEIEKENSKRERERREQEKIQRSIEFAGKILDTGAPSFIDSFEEIAKDWISTDENWFERSRQRPRLAVFQHTERSGNFLNPAGNNGVIHRPSRKPNDVERQAMGLASEWLVYQYLCRRHRDYFNDTCWISGYRTRFFAGDIGNDSAGYDFLVKTLKAEWMYEVKSSLEDSGEFELTANELRVASGVSKDGRRRYRILYVPYVFSPDKWHVLELPNPMGEKTRNNFLMAGRGSVRLRFKRQ